MDIYKSSDDGREIITDLLAEYLPPHEKIDFWIENPKLRDEYEHKYSESAKNYSLKNSIMKIEEMFYEEISERRKS